MKNLILSIVLSAVVFPVFAQANPWMGKQRALVLLVEWSDVPQAVSKQSIEDDLFKPDSPSLSQYFLENSVGKFELTGTVMDWRRSSVKWNELSDSEKCYPELILNAGWDVFGKDVRIADYDSNKDGKIDHLFVIHSGRIAHDRVGPYCMFERFAQANYAAVFQSQGTGSIGTALPIGFYIHEAGHGYYNFPDLYAQHYYGQYGIGMWGMMGLGAWGTSNLIPVEELFRFPSHFEPKSKMAIGWVKSNHITKSQKGVKLRPVETTGDIVTIPARSGLVTYYLEYRSNRGFSAGQRGHGLLIWNGYDIIQADGRDDINNGNKLGKRPLPPIDENFGDDSDPFPGSLNVREYAANGIRISNITQTDDEISFDVEVSNSINVPFAMPVEQPKAGRNSINHL